MTTARLARESSERSRALALIQETKRKQLSDSVTATPGSLAAGRSEYGDQWNAAEVREAKRRKDAVRGWARGVGGGEWDRQDVRTTTWDQDDRRKSESAGRWSSGEGESRKLHRPGRYWEV